MNEQQRIDHSDVSGQSPYPPIHDWSREGRHRLAVENEWTIRWLLDEAFTTFADEYSLKAFGFHDVEHAVSWCLDRFSNGELDPSRLSPASRSFRLFTEVRFWLAQKVGSRAFHARLARLDHMRAGGNVAGSPTDGGEAVAELVLFDHVSAAEALHPEDSLDRSTTLQAFRARLRETARALRARTCAALLTWWLEATTRLRQNWFGEGSWPPMPAKGPVEKVSPAFEAGCSKKQRSFYRHDALFRYLCLWLDLLPAQPASAPLAAVIATYFAPCGDKVPYRVPDAEALPSLVAFRFRGPREISQARRLGLLELIEHSLSRLQRHLQAPANGQGTAHVRWVVQAELTLVERLECSLLLASLTPTTLQVYQLTDQAEFSDQLQHLPSPLKEDDV